MCLQNGENMNDSVKTYPISDPLLQKRMIYLINLERHVTKAGQKITFDVIRSAIKYIGKEVVINCSRTGVPCATFKDFTIRQYTNGGNLYLTAVVEPFVFLKQKVIDSINLGEGDLHFVLTGKKENDTIVEFAEWVFTGNP